jgi:hypothetical protein
MNQSAKGFIDWEAILSLKAPEDPHQLTSVPAESPCDSQAE